jgi:translocation and assembly module TamB
VTAKPKQRPIDIQQPPISTQLLTQSPRSSGYWLNVFLKTGAIACLGLFLLVMVGVGVGRWWAKDHLAPIVAKELTKTLKRPIKFGEIENIWFDRLHLTNVAIPANGADQNQLTIRDVFVTFDPLQVIFDRTLKIDVRVFAPSIYLAQNIKGSWINLPAQEKTPPSPIKVEVGTVNIESATVVVVPFSKNPQPITISKINLQADVDDSQQRVRFNGGAQFAKSGQIQVQGNTLIANGKTQLVVNGKQLDAAAATKIVKIPEVEITQGTVDGNLNLEIELQKSLKISSKLLVRNGRLIINYVPRSLDQINGWIEVSERAVKFNDVATKYDRVDGVVNGDLNYYTGYHLNAKLAPIALANITKSIDVQSPFPLAGMAVGTLKLAGKLDRPVLTGKFNNSQTNQVDRVEIDQLSGDFKLADNKIKLNATATPQLGGKIVTQGEINLLKTPLTNFKVQGSQLPGDTLSRLYGARLPAQLKLGAATFQGTIGGAGTDIYTNIHVDAPSSSYPIAADLQITPQGKTLIKAATMAAAGGKVLATGEVTATNWLLNLQPQNLDTQKLATIGGMNLPTNYAGKLAGTIQATGSNRDLDLDRIQANGRLNLQLAAGQITANRFVIDRGKWQANVSSDALDLQQLAPDELASGESELPAGMVSGNFNLSGHNLKKIGLNQIVVQGSGKAKLKAGEIQSENLTISNGNWRGLFTTKDFQLAEINPKINGQLSGAFNLAGNLQQLKPESIQGVGNGTITLPQGKIFGDKLQLDRGKWQGQLQSTGLILGGLAPEIPANFKQAKLAGNVRVAGDLQQPKPQAIEVTGNAKLSLAGGTIAARQLAIRSGKWQGNFGLDRLKLGSVSNEIPAEFETAQLTGNFGAAGDLTNFKLDRLQVMGNGELRLDQAKVRATGFKLDEGNWSSTLAVDGAKLGTFNQQLSPQLQAGKISGKFNVAGNINQLTPTAIQASGNGRLNLANGGEIGTNNFALIDGVWQTNLAVSGIQLGSVNRELPAAIKPGLLFGKFQANGNLKDPDLSQVQASGNGQIRNILGGSIQVDQLKLDRGKWQSNVIADRLNIGQLAKFAPKNIDNVGKLAGQLSANWQIGGNLQNNSLANFEVLGQTKLTNLQVGQLKFDPNLIGNIQANPGQGVDISFAGKNDKLALSLDRNLQPQSFAVQQQGIIANGNVDGKILGINFQQLPVNLLQPWIPKAVGIEAYRFDGMAKGDLAINLTNWQVAGKQIEVTNPIFGAFQGDRLSSNFRYANGKFNLDNTEIQRGDHTYNIDASIDTTASTPTFQTKLQVPKGSIADIRNLLQIFSFNDLFIPFNQRKYGTAADLATPTAKIANRPQPIYNELRRLSELRRWLKKEADRQQETSLIPDVGNLQGEFSGEISISNSLKTGLKTSFNIDGSNWLLVDQAPVLNQPEHRYQIDRLQATGDWNNGKLHLDPLKLTIEQSQIDIAGDFGVNGQNAKLNVQNVPTAWLTSFVDLPVDIQGGINLTAQVSGNPTNPQASGEIALINGQLNSTKLQDPKVNFNYEDGRLNFTGDSTFSNSPIVSTTDRIKATGSIPYQLPFSLKPPANQDLRIDLSLDNQGLQMLDVFSKQQLHWIDGQGNVALKIAGKMKPAGGIASLSASGVGNIRQGRIKSVAIAEPFTDINGDIIFDFDRIDVQKLTGKLAKGQVNIAGIIPISDSFSIAQNQQLQIQMKGIPVNIPDKYNGDVNGNLKIIGTALNPILTGDVQLSNGQALLPDTSNPPTGSAVKSETSTAASPNSLQIRNLQITLGDNLQITRAPILSFLATGKIDINGTLDNPRPFGQVQLQKGSVNLFTTQFRLASGAQTADFFPTLGPDPVLNIKLYAKTLSSTANLLTQRNSIARTANKNGEIDRPADFYTTSLGSVQTVQVEARIAGLASQITERIELTSTPTLTQSEIVLLLGGAIVEQLSTGDNIGLGVASVAGSSLLNNIQDRISDLFNLSDFRLFPTIIKDSKTSSTSTLGIAAEVGTEISPKISTSVFKILTNSESPYYSIRYRLNDQLLLRGSTNLFGENRALLEFEQRF